MSPSSQPTQSQPPGHDDPPRAARAQRPARSGPVPELDRWTAVLRRATGSAVAALAVRARRSHADHEPVDRRGRPSPRRPSSRPAQSVEQFLTAQVAAPAWADGLHSYLEDSVIVDGHVLCTLGVADAAPRDWDSRDMRILDDATGGDRVRDPPAPGQRRGAALPRPCRLPATRARADRERGAAQGRPGRARRRDRAPRSVGDPLRGAARPRARTRCTPARDLRFRPTTCRPSTAS